MSDLRSKFTLALQSLEDREALAFRVNSLSDRELLDWAETIDESDFSLNDWLDALGALLKGIPNSDEISTWDAIEYLSCCAQGAQQSGSYATLKGSAEDYYRHYGFLKSK